MRARAEKKNNTFFKLVVICKKEKTFKTRGDRLKTAIYRYYLFIFFHNVLRCTEKLYYYYLLYTRTAVRALYTINIVFLYVPLFSTSVVKNPLMMSSKRLRTRSARVCDTVRSGTSIKSKKKKGTAGKKYYKIQIRNILSMRLYFEYLFFTIPFSIYDVQSASRFYREFRRCNSVIIQLARIGDESNRFTIIPVRT